jgi:hypothetical protein
MNDEDVVVAEGPDLQHEVIMENSDAPEQHILVNMEYYNHITAPHVEPVRDLVRPFIMTFHLTP